MLFKIFNEKFKYYDIQFSTKKFPSKLKIGAFLLLQKIMIEKQLLTHNFKSNLFIASQMSDNLYKSLYKYEIKITAFILKFYYFIRLQLIKHNTYIGLE